MNERSIFLDALELTDPEQRRKYLDQACGEDQGLRSQVEELLVSHSDASRFLEKPPEGLVATIATSGLDTVDDTAGEISLEFLATSDKSGCLGTLGPYEVIEVIGRGGMGIVLRAYDTKLNRVVAIKVMAPELAANQMAVKRFLREARAAAAVSHDHVVTIHAIDEENKPPFIVMEFVDGLSLQEKIDSQGALELKEILRIGMQTAAGLSAAHKQGLVHRDIKPANILLENGVERVKLTDFGLARAVDDVSVTQTGQIAGTPQFMSPEQAQGHAIDARSDLFSLGSVLYTMCTGRPPFRAETPLAMLRRVTDDTPRPIRDVNADVPDWLEAITLKLLAKDPVERFQSAEEVAELLSQHLAHLQHPTTAPKPARVAPPRKPLGWASKPVPHAAKEAFGKPSSRRVWPLLAAAVSLMAILVAAAAVVIYVKTDYGTIRVEVNDPNTTVTIDDELGLSFQNSNNKGSLTVRTGEHKLHIKQGDLEFETDAFRVKRGEEVVLSVELIEGKLGARLKMPETRRVEGGSVTVHNGRVIGMEETPDTVAQPFVLLQRAVEVENLFTTLAAAVSVARSGDTIEVRGNGPYVTQPVVIRHRALVIRAAEGFRPVIQLTPDVRDATPMIDTHAPLVIEGLKLARTSVVESDDEDLGYMMIKSFQAPLFVANCEFENQFIAIRAFRSPDCRIVNCVFKQPQTALAYIPPDGGRLLMQNNVSLAGGLLHLHYGEVESADGVTVDLTHNTIIGRPLWLFLHERPNVSEPHTPPIRFNFDNNVIDAVRPMLHFARGGKLLDEPEPLSADEMRAALRSTVDWHEGRNLLALRTGYLETGANSRPRSGPPFAVESDAHWKDFWNIDQAGTLFGRANFAGGDPRRLSEAERRSLARSLATGDLRLVSGLGVRASADGQNLGAAVNYVGPGDGYKRFRATSEYQRYRVFAESVLPPLQLNVPSITEIGILEGHTDIVGALDFLPDGKSLVSGSKESLHHWNLATGNVSRKIPVDSPVNGVAALPDGKHVVTSHFDGAVTLWNLTNSLPVRSFLGYTKPVFAITVSADGKRLLTGGHGGLVRLWDIETGETIHSFQETYCNAVAMSADGRFAAHGGTETSMIVWDVATGDVIQRVQSGGANFDAGAFSPDGRHLASGDYDGVVQVWEVATGKQVYHLDGHTAQVKSLRFTPDGRHLISGSFDKTIRVFELATGREVARAECEMHYATNLAFAPDGRTLASAGGYWLELKDQANWEFAQRKDGDYAIHLWRLPDGLVQSDSKKNSLGMTLRLIPAGEFEMGTADEDIDALPAHDDWFFADFVPDRRQAETPRHQVTISKPFEMSVHEVTVGQFRQFVEATNYKTTADQDGAGYGWRNGEWQEDAAFNWRNPGFEQTDDHPVCNVSWDDAVAFCNWLSEKEGVTYRLPTEAEWEYACRAGTTTLFWTGDNVESLSRVANLADQSLRKQQPSVTWAADWDDGFAATAAVGSFRPNAFGLQDMHGNVWEWCQDVYDDQWYETSPANDPLRRGSGRHVFRGGGFDNWPGFLRSADRYSSHSETIYTDWAGFRLVREISSESDQDGEAK